MSYVHFLCNVWRRKIHQNLQSTQAYTHTYKYKYIHTYIGRHIRTIREQEREKRGAVSTGIDVFTYRDALCTSRSTDTHSHTYFHRQLPRHLFTHTCTCMYEHGVPVYMHSWRKEFCVRGNSASTRSHVETKMSKGRETRKKERKRNERAVTC